jgi:carbohydrate-selective porin OprB
MPFVRAGLSEGNVPTYNRSVTLGFVRRVLRRADLAGLAINWGQPPDKALREQTTIEAFWRFQFARNLAFTPSQQLLLNPAPNPNEGTIWVTGLRIRMTF